MANAHLDYSFPPYSTVKHDAGGYHISHILIGLERIYGERHAGYLVPVSSKIRHGVDIRHGLNSYSLRMTVCNAYG